MARGRDTAAKGDEAAAPTDLVPAGACLAARAVVVREALVLAAAVVQAIRAVADETCIGETVLVGHAAPGAAVGRRERRRARDDLRAVLVGRPRRAGAADLAGNCRRRAGCTGPAPRSAHAPTAPTEL